MLLQESVFYPYMHCSIQRVEYVRQQNGWNQEVESAGAGDENDDLGLLSETEGEANPKADATEGGGPGVGSQKARFTPSP